MKSADASKLPGTRRFGFRLCRSRLHSHPTLRPSTAIHIVLGNGERTSRMNGHTNSEKLSQLPDEMFTLIKSSSQSLGPRLGRLALPGRRVIDTPHYLGNTSRGVVPHITQDTFRRDTHISGVFIGLEDCKSQSPTFGRPPVG